MEETVLLIYDGQCPFCNRYARLLRLRLGVGRLRLVDAREETAVMREITSAGLDIDQGMVLKLHGRLYYGDEAMHAIALLSSRSGLFNRLNYWLFRSPRRARLLYPALRAARNGFLKLLRRTRINNLDIDDNNHF